MFKFLKNIFKTRETRERERRELNYREYLALRERIRRRNDMVNSIMKTNKPPTAESKGTKNRGLSAADQSSDDFLRASQSWVHHSSSVDSSSSYGGCDSSSSSDSGSSSSSCD